MTRVFTLCAIMSSVNIPNAFMSSVIKPSVNMPNAIMPSVIIPNVVAPKNLGYTITKAKLMESSVN